MRTFSDDSGLTTIFDCGCVAKKRTQENTIAIFYCKLHQAAPIVLAALERIVDHFGDPLRCARPAIRTAKGRTA